jgi:hypothetical protein
LQRHRLPARGKNYIALFGKRSDGTLPLWAWLVFFLILSYILVAWHLARVFSRKPACSVVTGPASSANSFKCTRTFTDLTEGVDENNEARQTIWLAVFCSATSATNRIQCSDSGHAQS